MRRNIWLSLFVMVLVCICLPISVHADIGPKPSVKISIEGLSEESCYGTLLASDISFGPYHAWDEKSSYPDNLRDPIEQKVWQAFAEYSLSDGSDFYFMKKFWDCSEGELAWTYYPPDSFILLLYFPETDQYAVSQEISRYAFDSYFTVDLREMTLNDSIGCLSVQKSYAYRWELFSLVCRILLTILIETALAMLFGFRLKKQLVFITKVNAVTQILLNLGLNVINYSKGQWAFVFWYVLLELLVIILETAVFLFFFHKSRQEYSQGRIVGYALSANAFSFLTGYLLARFIPGIF